MTRRKWIELPPETWHDMYASMWESIHRNRPPEPYGPCPHLPHDHCLKCGPGTVEQIAKRNR